MSRACAGRAAGPAPHRPAAYLCGQSDPDVRGAASLRVCPAGRTRATITVLAGLLAASGPQVGEAIRSDEPDFDPGHRACWRYEE
ncbi:MAG: hypothetical protein LBG11_10815 [Bifidobacteriaceae bacterium]|nr:hypothetical protein [Bifidobacteriaceae bacterium]